MVIEKAHNIRYTGKDLSPDAAARSGLVEKSHQMGVPLIDIEGFLTIGFDEPALRKALHIT